MPQQSGASNSAGSGVRLAEIVTMLSLATDLGYGQPMEHVQRSCMLALRLGEMLGLDEAQRAEVYYVGLLACVGCFADAHEQARWFGDDISLKADTYAVDFAGLPMMKLMVGHVGSGLPAQRRAGRVAAFMTGGRREVDGMFVTHCFVAGMLAGRLGLSSAVQDGLQQSYERWDGRGQPEGLKGDSVAVSARLMRLSRAVEVHFRQGGVPAAIDVARSRSGSEFDPKLVDLFCLHAQLLLEDVAATTSWDSVVSAEPGLARTLSPSELDDVLEALADYADLKSPYTIGHSRAVADLATEAGRICGLGVTEIGLLRRAALVHDIGRLGVSNAIWDKPGPLTIAEQERVRLHPYLSERMLAGSAALAPLGVIAGQHHVRLDGSGYPQTAARALAPVSLLLAAADTYQAILEPRPHRPARTPDEAADELRRDVQTGRLDSRAGDAVLAAAGHKVHRRRETPAGLTGREVDVLRLLARGLSNKAIAERLVITPKTAGSHVEHIYAKLGVTSRAAASLYAAQSGLLPDAAPVPS
ncbi:MAG TPA: HD domain-containing phosphohydrolase [Mycobacteriales bacterium]|nr:HD domain-containing phosphohydrolase [Mycobacteriales bacterium]